MTGNDDAITGAVCPRCDGPLHWDPEAGRPVCRGKQPSAGNPNTRCAGTRLPLTTEGLLALLARHPRRKGA